MSEFEQTLYDQWVQRVPIRMILHHNNLTQKQFDSIRTANNFPERERAASPTKNGDPSVTEIEDACRELRKNWTEKQKISRLNGKKDIGL